MAAAPSSSLATSRLARHSAARSAAPERGTPDRGVAGAAEVLHERERPDAARPPARAAATTANPTAAAARSAIAARGAGCGSVGPRVRPPSRAGSPSALGPAPGRGATKRTCAPGVSRAGGVRVASHSGASVRPISCQPPGELRG